MRLLVLGACLAVFAGCASIAISAAPKKKPTPTTSPLSKEVNDRFWAVLHAGEYEKIEEVTELLQRAYLADPFDADTTAHLGFLHIWHLAERSRLEKPQATITDDMVLSRQYFAEAVEMVNDPRHIGFLAGAELGVGSIHKDEKLIRQGFFRMKDAVATYPEFNLFSQGYSMSQFPHDSERFQKGMEAMWKNVVICVEQDIDHDNPDHAPFMKLETTEGHKRACWNGWIAPHNHEGFALNLGDMLTKAGNTKAAKVAYTNAKLSKTYEQWPYKAVLEKRLEQLDENVAMFRKPLDEQPRDRRMMFNSAFSCSACHQGSTEGFTRPPPGPPPTK